MKAFAIALLFLIVNTANAQDHDHDHHHHFDHNHHSDHGNSGKVESSKRFTPTDDLKVRMEKILGLMIELKSKKDDVKIVKEYGGKVTETVRDIFKTCKLEPEADAAIHPALGLILSGASDLKNGKYESGHNKVHKALLDYEKLFNHQGWKH